MHFFFENLKKKIQMCLYSERPLHLKFIFSAIKTKINLEPNEKLSRKFVISEPFLVKN